MIKQASKIILVTTLLILVYLPSFPVPPLPRVAATTTTTLTLYGSANYLTGGWGFTSATISDPGPNIVVTAGQTVNMTMYSFDGLTHKFCVDLEATPDFSCNTTAEQATESPGFASKTLPTKYTLTAPSTPGNYTYFCVIHTAVSGIMTGTFRVLPAIFSSNLYGRVLSPNGFGLTASTVKYPGPDLVVSSGEAVSLSLFSGDNIGHTFCVDYNANGACDSSTEPLSPMFSSSTSSVVFNFTATTTPGNYTYFCTIHGPGSMKGKFAVLPVHNLAVSAIKTSRNFAYSGVTANPIQGNVTASNFGSQSETFYVATFANSTLIGNTTIIVAAGRSQIVTFSWSTSSFARGNYVLTAQAKNNNSTNSATDNLIFNMKFMGDITGDCRVDIADLALVAGAFGSTVGSTIYRPAADLNNDGVINIVDIVIVASSFGRVC